MPFVTSTANKELSAIQSHRFSVQFQESLCVRPYCCSSADDVCFSELVVYKWIMKVHKVYAIEVHFMQLLSHLHVFIAFF